MLWRWVWLFRARRWATWHLMDYSLCFYSWCKTFAVSISIICNMLQTPWMSKRLSSCLLSQVSIPIRQSRSTRLHRMNLVGKLNCGVNTTGTRAVTFCAHNQQHQRKTQTSLPSARKWKGITKDKINSTITKGAVFLAMCLSWLYHILRAIHIHYHWAALANYRNAQFPSNYKWCFSIWVVRIKPVSRLS